MGEAALHLYGAAGLIAEPLAGYLLSRREKRGKEDASRRGERFGHGSRGRPEGLLAWMHAASVGETIAVLPLAERLVKRGFSILMTTGTVTAAQVAERRLPAGAIHQYLPIDAPAAVQRFLDHWRPDLVLFAESELWPTTLRLIAKRGVAIVVVNARMSERSFRAWRRMSPLARAILSRVALWLAQSDADANRLRALGASDVVVCGNLKFDVPPPPAEESVLDAIRPQIAGRPVFLAASTHPGEETAVIAAHMEIAREGGTLLSIIAPRHPERGDAIASEIRMTGLSASQRSKGEPIGEKTDVLLADTIGEMGLWYRLADVALLGGSLVSRGGRGSQNPIEPAKLRVPILHGQHVGDFRDIYDALTNANAAIEVSGAATLAAGVKRLIADDGERERMAREAYTCVERFTGALERTMRALAPLLESSRMRP